MPRRPRGYIRSARAGDTRRSASSPTRQMRDCAPTSGRNHSYAPSRHTDLQPLASTPKDENPDAVPRVRVRPKSQPQGVHSQWLASVGLTRLGAPFTLPGQGAGPSSREVAHSRLVRTTRARRTLARRMQLKCWFPLPVAGQAALPAGSVGRRLRLSFMGDVALGGAMTDWIPVIIEAALVVFIVALSRCNQCGHWLWRHDRACPTTVIMGSRQVRHWRLQH